MRKKISVISPCLNEIKTIEKCIDNVRGLFLKLKNYDYEHIIVDNGSTDGSREIIEKKANSQPIPPAKVISLPTSTDSMKVIVSPDT